MVKDPVCGMEVAEQRAEHMLHFEHETIYFCSAQCKKTFAEESGLVKPVTDKGLIADFWRKLPREPNAALEAGPPNATEVQGAACRILPKRS